VLPGSVEESDCRLNGTSLKRSNQPSGELPTFNGEPDMLPAHSQIDAFDTVNQPRTDFLRPFQPSAKLPSNRNGAVASRVREK
jgi:hypothetical protein